LIFFSFPPFFVPATRFMHIFLPDRPPRFLRLAAQGCPLFHPSPDLLFNRRPVWETPPWVVSRPLLPPYYLLFPCSTFSAFHRSPVLSARSPPPRNSVNGFVPAPFFFFFPCPFHSRRETVQNPASSLLRVTRILIFERFFATLFFFSRSLSVFFLIRQCPMRVSSPHLATPVSPFRYPSSPLVSFCQRCFKTPPFFPPRWSGGTFSFVFGPFDL